MRWLDRVKRRLRGAVNAESLPAHLDTAQFSVVLYTRAGCHLCDEAKALLERHRARFGLTITEVDIDRDPALKAQYDQCVPVIEIDGKVRFRGRVNEPLLLRLLKAPNSAEGDAKTRSQER